MLSDVHWTQLRKYIKPARTKTAAMQSYRVHLLKETVTKLRKLDHLKVFLEKKRSRLRILASERTRLSKLLGRLHRQKEQVVREMNNLNQPVTPRYYMDANVYISKNKRFLKGCIGDISRTGVFVHTGERIFEVEEKVNIQIRPKGSLISYKAVATIVRFNGGWKYPSGYGLCFVKAT